MSDLGLSVISGCGPGVESGVGTVLIISLANFYQGQRDSRIEELLYDTEEKAVRSPLHTWVPFSPILGSREAILPCNMIILC